MGAGYAAPLPPSPPPIRPPSGQDQRLRAGVGALFAGSEIAAKDGHQNGASGYRSVPPKQEGIHGSAVVQETDGIQGVNQCANEASRRHGEPQKGQSRGDGASCKMKSRQWYDHRGP